MESILLSREDFKLVEWGSKTERRLHTRCTSCQHDLKVHQYIYYARSALAPAQAI